VVFNPSCMPVEGAHVRLWHTDARGLYGPPGTQQCCYYGGTVRTDRNGLFRLETIRPAQYPEAGAPPAHIHLEIRHSSGQLTTEIVLAESALTGSHGTVPMLLRSVRDQDGGNSWYGEATLVLNA
jgi:protocatechuate 3,4-dioxygenase beta subunit